MPYVSITRLRIRRLRFLLPFFPLNERALRQIRRAPGFLGGKLFIDARRTFWTATLWTSRDAAMAYRNTGAHMAAMPKLLDWCDEASVVFWDTPETSTAAAFPAWPQVHARMVAEGRRSKVRNPSAAHTAGAIPAPRWPSKMERPIAPVAEKGSA